MANLAVRESDQLFRPKKHKGKRKGGGTITVHSGDATLKDGASGLLMQGAALVAVHKVANGLEEADCAGKEKHEEKAAAKRTFALKEMAAGYFGARTFDADGLLGATSKAAFFDGCMRFARTI